MKTVEGGDNSVQEYGVEADDTERRDAATALQSYLNDRYEGNWDAACAALAQKPKEHLEELAKSASTQGVPLRSCSAAMAYLREPPTQLRIQAEISEVLSLRGGGDIPGDPSYLIFTGAAQTLYSMPMYFEEGVWKAGLARASELPV